VIGDSGKYTHMWLIKTPPQEVLKVYCCGLVQIWGTCLALPLAVLDLRVGHTMLSTFRVVCSSFNLVREMTSSVHAVLGLLSSNCRARSFQWYLFQEICLCLSWYDQSISTFCFSHLPVNFCWHLPAPRPTNVFFLPFTILAKSVWMLLSQTLSSYLHAIFSKSNSHICKCGNTENEPAETKLL